MLNLGARQTPPKVDRVPYIPMLEEDNVRQGFFKHQQYLNLLRALPSYLRPVLTFGYNTGWRKSEILGLTWDRVDLNEGTVRLEAGETKNSMPKAVYSDKNLLKMLKIKSMERHKRADHRFHKPDKPIEDF